jgi:replicative DNA helicase
MIDHAMTATRSENAVLGAVMVQPDLLERLTVNGSQFLQQEHGRLYDLLLDMKRAGKPIDASSIIAATKAIKTHPSDSKSLLDDLGGVAGIAKLISDGLPQHAVFHADDVVRWSNARNLRQRLTDALQELEVSDPDPTAIAQRLDARIHSVAATGSKREFTFDDLVGSVIDDWDSGETSKATVPWGLPRFDELLGGLYPTQLTVLAARPSIGKSALGFQVALNAAKRGKRIAFISCEMSELELGQRLLAIETLIPLARICSGQLTAYERQTVANARTTIKRFLSRVRIESQPTVAEIRSRCRIAQSTGGLDLLVIDYLSKLRSTNPRHDKYQRTTEVIEDLKGLAQELNIPVLCLCQLNREAGKSDDPPKLEHLRDSGAIEQEANNVLFIHRRRGEAETSIIVAKQRQGAIGSFNIHFDEEHACFLDASIGAAWNG